MSGRGLDKVSIPPCQASKSWLEPSKVHKGTLVLKEGLSRRSRLESQAIPDKVQIQPFLPTYKIDGDALVVPDHQASFTCDEGETRWISPPKSASQVFDIAEIVYVAAEGKPADAHGTHFQAPHPETVGPVLKGQYRLAPTGPHQSTGGVQFDGDGAAGGLSLSQGLPRGHDHCQNQGQGQKFFVHAVTS